VKNAGALARPWAANLPCLFQAIANQTKFGDYTALLLEVIPQRKHPQTLVKAQVSLQLNDSIDAAPLPDETEYALTSPYSAPCTRPF